MLNKRVGDRIKLYGINYRGIDLELEIVGVFPPGRYDKSAVINRDYFLNEVLEKWPREHAGKPHPLAEKRLNLVWLRVPNTAAFSTVAEQIESSPFYIQPVREVRNGLLRHRLVSRRLSRSALGRALSARARPRLISLALVIANAISISVRQRRMELAVMKVLGFRPLQILSARAGRIAASGRDRRLRQLRRHVVHRQQRLRRRALPHCLLSQVHDRRRRAVVGPVSRRPRRARRQHSSSLLGVHGQSVRSVFAKVT